MILKEMIILCTDRSVVSYPGRIIRVDEPRYFKPFKNFVLCPTGIMLFSDGITRIMRELGSGKDGIWDIKNLIEKKQDLQAQAEAAWELTKKFSLYEEGVPMNSDILFGGTSVDRDYRQFLGYLSSENNFDLRVDTKVGTYICLRHEPDILDYVTKNLEFFFKSVSAVSNELKIDLAKKFLPKILSYLHEKDWRISREGDLVFVDSEGVQTFSFGEGSSGKVTYQKCFYKEMKNGKRKI
jgi:hypothetical protein